MSKIQTNQLQHTANGAAVFTLPQTDGSADQVLKTNGSGTLAFTAITAGITEVDQWYLSANLNNTSDITANLVRNNFLGAAAQIGTGMTESSGIFTFPSTGKYMIFVHARLSIDSNDNINIATQVSTDSGSNFTTVAYASDGNNGSGQRDGASTSLYFLDVTNTSTVKVRFNHGSNSGNSYLMGDAGAMQTSFTFIRLGDT
tara:strand:+ start:65 stop:667 length:603 start_codon:yes stop_codon:yes gene_type:complete